MSENRSPTIPRSFDPAVVKSQVTDAALVQRRREQIVSAAVELFSAQGFYRTTIQEIARKAGVSTGLIYQYAQTKEDVLLLALMFVMERFRRELEASREGSEPLSRLYAAIRSRSVSANLTSTLFNVSAIGW